MTDAQRRALAGFVREALAQDLDDLRGELARMRKEIQTLERLVGLPGEPLAVRERRRRVVELRAAGYSQRAISAALHVSRDVITKDLRTMEAPVPDVVVGLDGRAVRGPRPSVRGAVM